MSESVGQRLTGIENCAGKARADSKVAPRYCFVCGLGPCPYGYTKILPPEKPKEE